MGRVAMEMYQGQHKEQEAIKNRLREANRTKLIQVANNIGIPFDWMYRRLAISGYADILDEFEEKLYRNVDSWISWELNTDRWRQEFDREFYSKDCEDY